MVDTGGSGSIHGQDWSLAGRYRLLAKIGEGATAVVWRARDTHLDREVALKLLRPHLLTDVTARARFTAEAQAAGTLSHAHIVAVYDFGDAPDGAMFIAMQYVPGPTLREWLQSRAPISASGVVTLGRQVAQALEVAHTQGLIHRDVKPPNILIRRDGTACLTDFGIVKALTGPALTQVGVTFGTADYMAPEQVTGGPLSPAIDIYALGCVMYEMLTGSPPFVGDSGAAVAYRQVWETPRPLRELAPQVPPALVAIVMRCLEKDPAQRYPSAAALIAALDAVCGTAAAPTQTFTLGGSTSSISLTWQPATAVPSRLDIAGSSVRSLMPSPLTRKAALMKTAMAPPTFQRAPRLHPDVPKGEFEIPPPPAAPSPPSTALLPILLPALFAAGMLVVTVFFLAGSNPLLGVMSAGFMGVSSAASVLGFVSQRRGYTRAVRERQAKYRQRLQAQRDQLLHLREQQQLLLGQVDPDPQECVARVERRDRRLWERSPLDADFLALRLGTGVQASAVTVKAPKHEGALDPDPLIQEAQQIAQEYGHLPAAPVRLPLRDAGAVGLAGPRSTVLNAARALAVQIATHHSPDEVKVAAIFPPDEAADWEWLRWLPHTWTDDHRQRLLASDKGDAHRLMVSLYEWLNRRLLQSSANRDPHAAPVLPYYVVFLADPRLVEHEPVLPLLIAQNAALAAIPVFLADRLEALPRGCQGVIELSGGHALCILTAPAPTQASYEPDDVPREWADRLARALAPIQLQQMVGPGEIPACVPLLEILGATRVEDLDLATRWHASDPAKSLAVPLGRRAGNEILMLDLHERGHGPHGLAAGATGSGKSELLQTLIAALAVQFHPHQVAFVLIDYKGGGMANVFQELPHLVGTITNLHGNLAGRALAALRSELRRRQSVFGQTGVNHIDEYQARYKQGLVMEPLPHLIIVADEFAELAAEQPGFMKELISAVRVGRSLGVHLLLATQKPAGVVNDQIWGNTRFRLCLRVERGEDSQEVLKRPDAANLVQPGRAYFQVGNNEVFELFQAAWGGAAYTPDGTGVADPEEIVEIALDGSRHPLWGGQQPAAVTRPGTTQLQALVAHIQAIAMQEGIRRLPGPWLPPIPDQVLLDQVRPDAGWDGHTWRPANTWMEPVVGLLDNPIAQYQGALALPLGREGHLAVYGAPGSGKTTFLQTIITALALAHSPADVQFYLLDFGSRLLSIFRALPHTGDIVLGDEAERVQRLLRWLQRELDGRKDRFAQVGVNTLAAYRAATAAPLPALVLALDNYTGFANAYPDAEDVLAHLAREGGNFGIHLILTAGSPGVVKTKVSASLTLAVALQLTDKADYSLAVGRTEGLEPAPLPGRGLVKGKPPLEFQTALPVSGDSDAARTGALRALIAAMDDAWTGPRPRPAPVLRDAVPLCEVLPPGDAWTALLASDGTAGARAACCAVDVDDLEPVAIDLAEGPHFLIAGPPQSGKTTLLQSWLLALAERYSPEHLHLYLVDFRRAGLLSLRRLPHVRAYITDDDRLGQALAEIGQALPERRQALEAAHQAGDDTFGERALLTRYPVIVLAIDDLDCVRDQAQTATKDHIEQLIRRERGLGVSLMMAGGSNDWQQYEGWIKALKELQTGFILGSSEQGDLGLLNVRLPFGEGGTPVLPGQGFYSRRGRFRKIKVATAHAGSIRLTAWVDRLVQRTAISRSN